MTSTLRYFTMQNILLESPLLALESWENVSLGTDYRFLRLMMICVSLSYFAIVPLSSIYLSFLVFFFGVAVFLSMYISTVIEILVDFSEREPNKS